MSLRTKWWHVILGNSMVTHVLARVWPYPLNSNNQSNGRAVSIDNIKLLFILHYNENDYYGTTYLWYTTSNYLAKYIE